MKVVAVTPGELAIAAIGYDSNNPTQQQETLASIYIRHLYEQNGKPMLFEVGDVAASTDDLQSALSEVTLPVKYASWLPQILGLACDVISLTSSSSVIIREIGINAIDRLIDHAIRVIFDNLFEQDAPIGEQGGEVPATIQELTKELIALRQTLQTTDMSIVDEGKGRIFSLTVGGLEVGG